eukprot:CAMPEP_0181502166 /NCGR_PEP_ID=MMETSP1110-20121109/56210_1 /TAXON_ID=174948 /ORGANISM="Symbiodinium sp., Strain CCMP421" /LENGTH=168 /DNA_ID=CAMNT_0023630727 /DNA_START=312 /DNA_END=815 /DNA_ORIENTATION=-
MELHFAIPVSKGPPSEASLVNAIRKDLAGSVSLEDKAKLRVGLNAKPLPAKATVQHHRVAIVKGKRCPDIHVNALRIKAQKVSENEPVLAKLGDRGVRALLCSKLIAAKLQHVGILKNAFEDSGGADPAEAIPPHHEVRSLPERVEMSTCWAGNLCRLADALIGCPDG